MQPHQLIFFVIGLVVSLPVLVYYYRRAGHRRFRPKLGEMVMVCLFAVMACGGGAMLMGSFLDDPDQFKVDGDLSVTPGPGAGEVSVEGEARPAEGGRSERRNSRSSESSGGSRDDRRGGRGEKKRGD